MSLIKVFKRINSFLSRYLRIAVIQTSPDIINQKPATLVNEKVQQILYFDYIIKKTKDIPGVFVECGVGHGRSIFLFASIFESKNINRKIYAFDSFVGFPEISEADKVECRNVKKGYYKSNLEGVKKHLYSSGLSEEFVSKNILFYKGYFKDTLKEYNGGEIAILHIDCDLGESYKEVLEQLYQFVSKGGIIMFDEYESSKWVNASKVINVFFKNKPEKILKFELSKIKKFYVIKR